MVNLDHLQNKENSKKKKNKRKLNDEVDTVQANENGAMEVTEVVKKKKKKKSTKEEEAQIPAVEEQAAVESPFKKDFYSMQAATEAVTKKEVKEYRQLHNITLYGKGRKAFKPLFTFAELGFPASIMNICAKFQKPSPIQVPYGYKMFQSVKSALNTPSPILCFVLNTYYAEFRLY
jgi:ATP-dependent RNA helicase DBP3